MKAILINKYIPQNAKVIDLAWGKGGDLGKYIKNNIDFLVGIDISKHQLLHF